MRMIQWAVGMVLVAGLGCGDAVNTSGTSGGIDSGTGGGGGDVCNDACAAQARANCSAFQMGTCVSSCQAQLSGFPQCRAQIEAAGRCAAGATYTCNSSNRPTTMSCLSEGIMAFQCTQGDAGP